MIFISFGKRCNPKKPFEATPFHHTRVPNYEKVYRQFAGSALARTLLKKITEAGKQLGEMDSKPPFSDIHPTDHRYQEKLKKLYTAKYSNSINYWIAFRDFAKNSSTDSIVINSIENRIKQATDEWNAVKKFL